VTSSGLSSRIPVVNLKTTEISLGTFLIHSTESNKEFVASPRQESGFLLVMIICEDDQVQCQKVS
jgi:hypothetical protein